MNKYRFEIEKLLHEFEVEPECKTSHIESELLEEIYHKEGMAIYYGDVFAYGIHPNNLENNLEALINGDMKFDWKSIKERTKHIKGGYFSLYCRGNLVFSMSIPNPYIDHLINDTATMNWEFVRDNYVINQPPQRFKLIGEEPYKIVEE